jgi:hypothetical protein
LPIFLSGGLHIINLCVVENAKPTLMRQMILLLYSLILISCNQNTETQDRDMQKPDREKYAIDLINNEFLEYADSSRVDTLKIQLKNSFDIYDAETFRIARIDAEELSEFSFDFFLPGLNKILAKRGVRLSAQKLNEKENSHDVLINGHTINLYTEEELNSGKFWNSASRNFFRELNKILKGANSNERFYLLYGGNDLHAILLTEKQFSIITEYQKNDPREAPYKP